MGGLFMNKIINVGHKESALSLLRLIKDNDYVPFDIRITNSHIVELNKVIGKTIFRKDSLYISSRTLWEIMQPLGGKGKHHFHNLKPEEIFDTLEQLKYSKNISLSYDGRYLIITLSSNGLDQSAVIIEPNGSLKGIKGLNVARIVTIYPYKN